MMDDMMSKRGLKDVSKSPEELAGKTKQPDLKTLLNETGKGLAQIAEMVQMQPGLAESDKAKMQELLGSYIDFVESKLSGEESGQSQEEPMKSEAEGMGQVSMEGGMTGKPMNMSMRQ